MTTEKIFTPLFHSFLRSGRLVSEIREGKCHAHIQGVSVRLDDGSLKAVFGIGNDKFRAYRNLADQLETARALGQLEIN